MALGSAWMVASRWMLRLIGLLSTVVLARILTPVDFGLVAMAMMIVGAVEVLGETGQRLALIRLGSPTREHYDTAWTFSVLVGLGIALVLALAAPVAAHAFGEPRVQWLVWCLALRPAISGFYNIGLVDLQRNLDFRRDQQVILTAKLVSFVVTLSLALSLRSYWALVLGILAHGLAQLALGYVYSPYRPRFCLAKAGELWSFSAWTLATQVTQYFADRADQIVVGLSLGAPAMGIYVVGGELATLPTDELVIPPARALYAVYARLSQDRSAMRGHYLAALSFIALIACAPSTGIALVAEDAVRIVLGEQWLATIPLMPWLALSAGILGIARSAITVLFAAGHARANAFLALVFVALLLAAASFGIAVSGIEGAAAARLAATLVIAPALMLMLMRLLEVPAGAIVGAVWRPALAAATMAATVMLAHPHLPPHPALRLGLEAALGATSYACTITALWLAAGRPAGAEKTVAGLLLALPAPWRRAARAPDAP
jgi:O-antigen/teichoic acid export membrane protein